MTDFSTIRLCTRCGWTIDTNGCGCTAEDKAKPLPVGAWRTIPDPDFDPEAARRIVVEAERLATLPEHAGLAAKHPGQLIHLAYWEVVYGGSDAESDDVVRLPFGRRESKTARPL